MSGSLPPAWDEAPHRPARRRVEGAVGDPQVGRGAHLRVAAPLPEACRPLRTQIRHSPGLPQSRLYPHLLVCQGLGVLLGVLRALLYLFTGKARTILQAVLLHLEVIGLLRENRTQYLHRALLVGFGNSPQVGILIYIAASCLT